MLQELVQVERFASARPTVVGTRHSTLINMFYPPLYGYLAAVSEPKLERPRVQRNLADLLSNEKL